jgi:hypothetical protein
MPGWAVEIHGAAVMRAEADGKVRASWLFINRMAGEVTVEALG